MGFKPGRWGTHARPPQGGGQQHNRTPSCSGGGNIPGRSRGLSTASSPVGLGPQPCSDQPPAPGRGPSRARPETRCSPGWSFPPVPSNPAARPFTEAPGRGLEGPGSLSGASDGRRSQSCLVGPGCSVIREQPIRGLGIGSGCTLHGREGVLWAGDWYWRGQETGAQRPPDTP